MEYIYTLISQIDTLDEALLAYALFICFFVHLPFYIFVIRPDRKEWNWKND